jgi:hypothetical protein
MLIKQWLWTVLALGVPAALMTAQGAAPDAGRASYDEVGLDQKISPKMMEWFRAGVPKDAMGLAIVQAQVQSIRTTRYCPQNSPLCGLSPTCGHPGAGWGTSANFKIIAPLIKRQRPVIPAAFEQALNPPGISAVHAGDMVWVAFHSLSTNQQPRIGWVEAIPSLKRTNAPPAAPAK